MSELLNEVLTPELMLTLKIVAAFFIVLWVLCIVYVAMDARRRGTVWILWTIIAIVPILGLIAYIALRTPLYLSDREEQNLDITLRERQLSQYGECPKCGTPVERNFIACPKCATRLRNVCTRCNRPLEPDWVMCPYCTTRVGGGHQ